MSIAVADIFDDGGRYGLNGRAVVGCIGGMGTKVTVCPVVVVGRLSCNGVG